MSLNLKQHIRAKAKEIGFDMIGFAKAEAVDEETASHVRNWLDDGFQARMGYLENRLEARLNPLRILPEARTVVAVACNYHRDLTHAPESNTAIAKNKPGLPTKYCGTSPLNPLSMNGEGTCFDLLSPFAIHGEGGRGDEVKNRSHSHKTDGSRLKPAKISRYAAGRDYHKTLGNKLRQMERWLAEAYPGEKSWSGVDAGPSLEKYWAQKAGLGWIGRNTCLITPRYGSWVFLGVLLTSLEIPPDIPHKFHCGSCQRCLDACPTKALVAPFRLDSRRCVSYWTIEHRGEFPEGTDLAGWAFGCDDCQTVCPWNRHQKTTAQPDFLQTNPLLRMTEEEIANLSQTEWDALTRGSAIRRATCDGLLRNCRHLIAQCEKTDD